MVLKRGVADIVHSKIGYWLLLPSEKGYLESQIRDIELEGKDDDIIVKITMSDECGDKTCGIIKKSNKIIMDRSTRRKYQYMQFMKRGMLSRHSSPMV